MRSKLSATTNWLKSSPVRVSIALGFLLVAIGIAKYGLSMWAGWRNLYEVALYPGDPSASALLQVPQDYILLNATPSLLLGLAGITGQSVYVSIQVLAAILALLLPFLMPSTLRNSSQSRLLFLLLVGGPLLPLLLTWIGGYDALVVVGMVLAILGRRRPTVLLGWLLAAIGHNSLALIGAALWLLWSVVTTKSGARLRVLLSAWPAALGVTVGFVWISILDASYGGVTSRLEVFQLYPIEYYVNSFVSGLPVVLFSALGVGWAVLLDKRVRATRPTIAALALIGLAAALLPLFAIDHSRIVAVATLPILLAWIRGLAESGQEGAAEKLFKRYAFVASLVPIPLVVAGEWSQTGWQELLYWRAGFR